MSSKILWMLGAGASKHLDLPLLSEFPRFLTKIKGDNRDNEPLRNDCDETLKHLSTTKGDIEQLLRGHQIDCSLGQVFRRCIRKSFYLRHNAVFTIRDVPLKYKAYSYFLCLVEKGDSIVSFNYDTSIERTIENANRPEGEHRRQRRIPPECLDYICRMKYKLLPESVFRAQPCNTGTFEIDLVKLHGSINWQWNESTGKLTALDSKGEPEKSFLVYPDPEKLEVNQSPVSDLVEMAKQMVETADVIVIAGYSFPKSDLQKHPFVKHLRENLTQKFVIFVDPRPSTALLELAKTVTRVVFFPTKFESVFSSNAVDIIGRFLNRTPHLSSNS